jgi:hypothetical protein
MDMVCSTHGGEQECIVFWLGLQKEIYHYEDLDVGR